MINFEITRRGGIMPPHLANCTKMILIPETDLSINVFRYKISHTNIEIS